MTLHFQASSCRHEPDLRPSQERALPLSDALVCQRSVWVYGSNLRASRAVQQLLRTMVINIGLRFQLSTLRYVCSAQQLDKS
jgi:hypothetical protein